MNTTHPLQTHKTARVLYHHLYIQATCTLHLKHLICFKFEIRDVKVYVMKFVKTVVRILLIIYYQLRVLALSLVVFFFIYLCLYNTSISFTFTTPSNTSMSLITKACTALPINLRQIGSSLVLFFEDGHTTLDKLFPSLVKSMCPT